MIRIQNIYYMLAYAYRVLEEDGYRDVETCCFEYVSSLLAAILSKGIANQIRKGLGREYERMEAMSSPRGKIDFSTSIKQQTLLRKKLHCFFDTFSENTYMNQILKTTALLLLRCPDVASTQKQALRKVMPYFSSIDTLDVKQIQWSRIVYHRNNATYKMLINICYLVLEGLLLTQEQGEKRLSRYLDDQRMHALYERFVRNYYRKHFPHLHPTSRTIEWMVDDAQIDFLPTMKTDVTLECKDTLLIIDTKYYARSLQTSTYNEKQTLWSSHLYQIFSYVKNAQKNKEGSVQGVLLYAKTEDELTPSREYSMGGNRIVVRCLDLNAHFSQIAKQLDSIVEYLGLDSFVP